MKIEPLSKQLKSADSLPFLFIGSGMSKRYLNLPTWDELLRKVSQLVSQKDYYYSQQKAIIKQKIDPETNYNKFMTGVCDIISNDLTSIWYTDARFEKSREKYKDIIETKEFLPIKAEIASIISESKQVVSSMNNEIELLKSISKHSIAGIITTNYDTFLEEIFNFSVYNSQNELLFRSNYEIGEIYKIHGNVTEPNTIMITSKDYQLMEDRNKYLAAKLLTIFVEHPIIFVGYSLEDENIRSILEAISQCLNNEQKRTLSTRLIFIEWDSAAKEVINGNQSITFEDGTSLNITKYSMNSFETLFSTISYHKSKIPVQALRKLKHSMYDLALTSDGNTKIQVMNPDKIIESDDYEIIAGFGIADLARRGYKSITTKEIFIDIILDNQSFNYEYLAEETLPSLIKSVNGSLPFYKYIQTFEEIPEALTPYSKNKLDDFLSKSMRNRKPLVFNSIHEIIENSDEIPKQLSLIPLLKNKLNLSELEKYLIDLLENNPDLFEEKQPTPTNLKRLIKIYDWMKFGQ